MSKREADPNVSQSEPDLKKQKVDEKKQEGETSRLGLRTRSPIPGPSHAPSDPDLQVSQTDLIPICRYFDPSILEESSSQASMSATDAGGTTSTTDTSCSTNVEVGDSRSASLQDVNAGVSTSESSTSTSTTGRRTGRRQGARDRSPSVEEGQYSTHRSRRDQ